MQKFASVHDEVPHYLEYCPTQKIKIIERECEEGPEYDDDDEDMACYDTSDSEVSIPADRYDGIKDFSLHQLPKYLMTLKQKNKLKKQML